MPTLADLKIQAENRGLAVSGSKTQLEERLRLTANWRLMTDTVYFLDNLSNTIPNKTHIASYDLDGTLIQPRNINNEFCEGIDDWMFRPGMKEQVEEKQKEGMFILIFTNQARKALRHVMLARLEQVVTALGACSIFVATGRDKYRKPETGMWDLAVSRYNLTPDLTTSFFCGDASGLAGSFSDADAGFARGTGLTYILPLGYCTTMREERLSVSIPVVDVQEMVLLVGAPASGKSTLARDNFPSYTIASKDLHRNRDLEVATTALMEGKSVVIDNTNPSRSTRDPYLSLARSLGVPVRIIVLSTRLTDCKSRNLQREHPVPSIVYNVYKSNYQEPSDTEAPVLRV